MTVASKGKSIENELKKKKAQESREKANSSKGNAESKAKPRKRPKTIPGADGAGKDKNGRKPNSRKKKPNPAEVAEEDKGTKKADPFEVAKQTVKGSVPAIVEAMVELAKQGSCTHAKTLLEMAGANRMFDGEAEAQDNGEPWAKLVLERLDEAEAAESQEKANPADEPKAEIVEQAETRG